MKGGLNDTDGQLGPRHRMGVDGHQVGNIDAIKKKEICHRIYTILH